MSVLIQVVCGRLTVTETTLRRNTLDSCIRSCGPTCEKMRQMVRAEPRGAAGGERAKLSRPSPSPRPTGGGCVPVEERRARKTQVQWL